ncbi:MAG: zinc-binding dehydrogenase [Clostridia bacterium]|nr:zinc-binding dehydrogenase [Clostridia bacterium]
MKTNAVRLYGENDLRLEEFDLRDITDSEILIKIVCDSVCMSTYKTAKQGEKHIRVPNNIANSPIIVGHEFCGEIIKVGKRWCNQYSVGEKIIIPPALGYMGMNTIGYSFSEIGGDSTYAIVYEHIIENGYLIKFNSDAFYKGSIIEPASCVLRGYKGTHHLFGDDFVSGLKQNGKVAILAGCGPMGLEAIDIVLSSNKTPALVLVTDINIERLERAKSLFEKKAIENKINLIFSSATTKNELLYYSNGEGFDDVFVYAPVAELIELADSLLAFDGCLNFFAGPIDKNLKAKVNFYDIHYSQHHFSGTSGSTVEDIKETAQLISQNKINPAVMITHIGGLNSVIETTLNLPQIPGGKKLIYTHINLPLTAISDFKELGKTDERFNKLFEITDKNNGIWSAEAEKYLLENF